METAASSHTDRRYFLRIKPVGVLTILVFLLIFNAVAVFSYEYGLEVIHVNVLFYMYFYFWITFFLIAVQISRILNQQEKSVNKLSDHSN